MNLRNFIAIVFVLGTACVGSSDPSASIKSAISECYDAGDPACLEGLDSSEPDEVFDACFEEHARCLEGTPDPEACDPLLDACFDVYDESDPVDDAIGFCYDEGEQCTRELGVSADECLEMVGECLESIEDVADPGDAPDVAEICFEGHIACLESMGPPEECDLILEECLHAACPPEEPPSDPCFEAVEACIASSDPESAEMCIPLADECYEDPGEPDDCFEDWEAFDWCLSTGEDPAACEEFIRCDGDVGAPPPCPSEESWFAFDECLSSGADPAECEELIACEYDPGEPDPDEIPHGVPHDGME